MVIQKKGTICTTQGGERKCYYIPQFGPPVLEHPGIESEGEMGNTTLGFLQMRQLCRVCTEQHGTYQTVEHVQNWRGESPLR